MLTLLLYAVVIFLAALALANGLSALINYTVPHYTPAEQRANRTAWRTLLVAVGINLFLGLLKWLGYV